MIHICVEGLDGTGKSTLVESLFQRMVNDNAFCQWIYKTKEPGSAMKVSPNLEIKRPGADLRKIVLEDGSLSPMERELLFYADASQHQRFISNQGKAIVISDRGLWSHYAYLYATMKTKQMDYDAFLACKKIIDLVCAKPNFTIYLQGSLELMKKRNVDKLKDVIESNEDDFFAHVLSEYEKLAQNIPCLVLDASLPTSVNVNSVLTCLKENYTNEELQSGDLELCQF